MRISSLAAVPAPARLSLACVAFVATQLGFLTHRLAAEAGFKTSEPAYLNSGANGDYRFDALITVGDYVPLSSGTPSQRYAFVGVPDGMGLHLDPVTGERVLFISHELGNTTLTTPVPGAARLRGSLISRFSLGADASFLSGGVAYRGVYRANELVSALPLSESTAGGFNRFCSGSFAGPAHGMDRPIFFTNEESSSANFDAAGSQSVAVIDGRLHTLPDLGRIGRENTLVMPRRDAITAIVSTEDMRGSYVYLYVGEKQRRSTDVLAKNGLSGGRIYVLGGRGADAGKGEATFRSGTMQARWIPLAGAAAMNDVTLFNTAKAAGAFPFVRVEDAEFDPLAPTRTLFFASTGTAAPNLLGRFYRLDFDPRDPAANCTLSVIFNSDDIVTPGGDINAGRDFIVSPDNIAVTADRIVICEDKNAPADAVLAKYGRNGGVWTLDRRNNYAAKYQGDFNMAYTKTRDGATSLPGFWEASGVVDASSWFGPGAFLINVQAHRGTGSGSSRTNIPKPSGGYYTASEASSLFAEDGQVLLMRPR